MLDMTRVFTMVLEFAGGTYISQYRGSSPQEAIQHWAVSERKTSARYAPQVPPQIFMEVGDQAPVPVENLDKVW